MLGGLSNVVKRIAILSLTSLTVLAVLSVFLIRRESRTLSQTAAELKRFVLVPAGPKRMKESCSDLHTALATVSSEPRFNPKNSIRNRPPLSPDEIAVYQAVLSDAMQRGWKRLNISVITAPLSIEDFRDCECFEDINLDNLPTAFRTSHSLAGIVLPTKGMRLVDPDRQSSLIHDNDPSRTIREGTLIKDAVNRAFQTGLFSMSEIAFDKEHRYAVVSYNFWCGLLCGNGATLIFERVGNGWKKSDRDCGGWIS